MPTIQTSYSEDDIQALVANDVRKTHKLSKDHSVTVLCVIDRKPDGEGNIHSTVTAEAQFEKTVEPTGKGGK